MPGVNRADDTLEVKEQEVKICFGHLRVALKKLAGKNNFCLAFIVEEP